MKVIHNSAALSVLPKKVLFWYFPLPQDVLLHSHYTLYSTDMLYDYTTMYVHDHTTPQALQLLDWDFVWHQRLFMFFDLLLCRVVNGWGAFQCLVASSAPICNEVFRLSTCLMALVIESLCRVLCWKVFCWSLNYATGNAGWFGWRFNWPLWLSLSGACGVFWYLRHVAKVAAIL